LAGEDEGDDAKDSYKEMKAAKHGAEGITAEAAVE
jgi:hypothetical protein